MATQTQVAPLISSSASQAKPETFLRRVVLADAIFEVVCGTLAVVGANGLADSTGLFSPAIFTLIGIGLFFGAAFIYWLAVAQPLKRSLITFVMVGNDIFALGCALVLLAGWGGFTESARLMLVLIGADIGILAGLEWWGLRRIK